MHADGIGTAGPDAGDPTPAQGVPAATATRGAGEPTPRGAAAATDPTPTWAHLPAHLGLTVSLGQVPTELPGDAHPWEWLHVTPEAILVDFGGDTRLLISDGRDVTLQWDDAADPEGDPSWLLQGWAVTLAALQRGDLSLHAATVRVGEAVVAIAGDRGAGKSTTALGLRNRGHELLVDDVTLLEFRDDGAWTTPYARNVHLLPDAAAGLGIDFAALAPLALGRDKSAFRAEDPPIEPHRIDLVVVLDPDLAEPVGADEPGEADEPLEADEPGGADEPLGPGDRWLDVETDFGAAEAPRAHGDDDPTGSDVSVTVTEVRGAQRLRTLIDHTVRDGLAPLILGQSAYFTQLARLADSAPVHVLRRPAGAWSLDEVLDAIERLARDVAMADGQTASHTGPPTSPTAAAEPPPPQTARDA